MTSHLRARRAARRLVAAAVGVLVLAGCSRDSSSPGRHGAIHGVVHDSAGAGVAYAVVHAVRVPVSGQPIEIASADADGLFSISLDQPGTYLVGARGIDDVAVDTVVVPSVSGQPAAETTFVAMTLVAGGVFTGTATAAGPPNDAGTVVVADGWLAIATTDSTGRYRLEAMATGTWPVIATRTGYRAATTTGTLPAPGDSVELAPMVLPVVAPAP